MNKKLLTLIVTVLVVLGSLYGAITGQTPGAATPETTVPEPPAIIQTDAPDADEPDIESEPEETEDSYLPDVDGHYDSMRDVALYIHLYGRLPENYITKSEARRLGWEGGSVERYAPGCCIGGDTFRNNEGQLPDAKGRKWTECDIDTLGEKSRGAKRIVFSNDGLIYYTDDHYETFELLYGEP